MDFAIVSAIVVGLTQVFKMFEFNERLTPVFAILSGVVINLVAGAGGVAEQALWGIVAGLAAMGVYSGTKTVLKN
jgi:hypothetical protein